jgi:transposase
LLQDPEGTTSTAIAKTLGVSERSAQRYLSALQEQGLAMRTAKQVNSPHTRWVGGAPERWEVILAQLPVEHTPPDESTA